MKDDRLLPLLERYAPTMLPMHMPGGKRRFPSALPYGLDVTEVEGLDDLHDPHGVLLALEKRASALWGAEQSFVLVNGSTGGLLAAVRALGRSTGSGKLLIARNCHRSVYNAAELCRREAVYVLPEPDGEIAPASVERALASDPQITAAVITSPTYEGVISDIAAISEVCRRRGVTLIVDEAHGAHLAFFPGMERFSAVRYADIVVQSLHKTLPALTQTAVLHCRAPFAAALRRENGVFETSSPSYLLLASADECFAFLEREGKDAMARYAAALDGVRGRLERELAHLRLFSSPRYDAGKLLLLTGRAEITGVELAHILRRSHAVETEFALPDRLLAMTSVCDDAETLSKFASALLAIDRSLRGREAPAAAPQPFPLPEQVLSAFAAGEALDLSDRAGEGVCLPVEQAVGRVSLEYVWAYPPGVPLLVPGERIGADLPQTVSNLAAAGVSVRSSSRCLPLLRVL